MKLKQLLGILLLTTVCTTMAAAAAPSVAKPAKTISIKNVAVVRGKSGMQVEILATGPVTPQTMKLASPDRVVLDLPNTIPATKRELSVNGADIKTVRMARFQVQPPVTRIVVDLAANRDYELVPDGNKIILKLHEAKAEVAAAPAEAPATIASAPETAAAPATAASDSAAAAPKNELVVLAAPVVAPQPAKVDPAARAADAASKFHAQPQGEVMPSTSASLNSAQPVNFLIPQQAATFTPASSAKRYTGEPI